MSIDEKALAGTWDMVHDDWQGTLKLKPTGVSQSATSTGPSGSCTYHSSFLTGTWTGSSGSTHTISQFLVGGYDRNRRRSEPCPDSYHFVRFQIEFDPRDPQPFEGYVHTNSKSIMSGYTWWNGLPFGWYATR